MMRCAICHHSYNLKNVRTPMDQCHFYQSCRLKVTLLHGCFSRFENCLDGFQMHKWSRLTKSRMISNDLTRSCPIPIKYSTWRKYGLTIFSRHFELPQNVIQAARRYPASIYLLKVNNKSTRTKLEICSKLTTKTPEQRQVSLLLILNIFQTLF